MSRWQVVEPYQVHHDGVTYAAGETFEASDDTITREVDAGWLKPAESPKPKTRGRPA